MTDKIVPVALRLWLLFLFLLLLLGYSVVTSIIFGAVGGLAGGITTAWWHTPGGEPEATQEPSAFQKVRGGFQPGLWQERLPFLRLFTRRDRRSYTKSRR